MLFGFDCERSALPDWVASSSSFDIFTFVIPITDLQDWFLQHCSWCYETTNILVWCRRNNSSILQIFLSKLVSQAQEVGESPIYCRVLLLEVRQVGGGGDCVGHVGGHPLSNLQGQHGKMKQLLTNPPCEDWSLWLQWTHPLPPFLSSPELYSVNLSES